MWLDIYDLTIVVSLAVIILCLFSKPIENGLHAISIALRINQLQIRVVTNKLECTEACALIKQHCQDLSVLGFDCEWVSYGISRPVSLLQLSTVHGLCCLFRLQILRDIPQDLQSILNNCDIIKVGVSPGEDAKKLQRDYNVQVFNTLDLRHLYPSVGGLSSLSKSVLGITLDKDPCIRGSNWEISELTQRQKTYAAKDAFVGIEIFKKWLLDKSETKFAILRISYENLFNGYLRDEIYRVLGVPFTENSSPKKANKIFPEVITSKRNQEVNQQKSTHVTRKTPLYHNCFMHAPDGELLCSCDTRKAEWYLARGLAELLPGEPFSIKLLFEPADRANEWNGGRYYQLLKQNCCVVCGAKESYLKHNVVPREYRKHFPKVMKNHQSHDVVLMCINCHLLASQYVTTLKGILANYCNAPINSPAFTQSKTRQKIKNYARALLTSGKNLPYNRRIFLENELKNYFTVDHLTTDLLRRASTLNSNVINQDYESHGSKVVNFFSQQPMGLIELEKAWRLHFLITMKPKFLPALWSVDHNHSRLRAQKNGMA